jgi:hypothetical protein
MQKTAFTLDNGSFYVYSRRGCIQFLRFVQAPIRRYSLEKLAIDLLMPFINSRVQKMAEKKFKSVSKDVQESFARIGVKIEKKEESSSTTVEPKPKKSRCEESPRSRDRKTKVICTSCVCVLFMSCIEAKRKAIDEEKTKSTPYKLKKKK